MQQLMREKRSSYIISGFFVRKAEAVAALLVHYVPLQHFDEKMMNVTYEGKLHRELLKAKRQQCVNHCEVRIAY